MEKNTNDQVQALQPPLNGLNQSNADCIRKMSDIELAQLFFVIGVDACCYCSCCDRNGGSCDSFVSDDVCRANILDWLTQTNSTMESKNDERS